MESKAYLSLNDVLKKEFHTKIIKLSLDGGFTCPNRDGSLGSRGCIFCTEKGSGEFTLSGSIHKQMQAQVQLLSDKWKEGKYIAYFQNFTNTYKPVAELKRIYEEALAFPDTVGLAIATRPDCLSDEILDLLEELSKRTYLWIELGLQSIYKTTEVFIRRAYPLSTFEQAVFELHQRGIRTVVHLILGFPNEDDEMILKNIDYLNTKPIWGVKLHNLYIADDSDLGTYYKENPFYIRSADEYMDLVISCLRRLRRDIVIHRLTGDGDKKHLIEPKWILNKRYILNGIHKKMREQGIRQGDLYMEGINVVRP